MRKEGLIVFSLELGTSFVISKLDEEQVAELLTIGLGYYLNPVASSPAASDTITLEEPL